MIAKAEQIRIDEDQLNASICRDSFYEFVKEFWGEVIREKMIDNWHIKYLCDEIQIVLERIFRWVPKEYDLAINVPPGTSKTTILSIMMMPWAWTRMPAFRFIGASYKEDLQLKFAMWSRQVIRSDKYQRYFPEIQVSKDMDAKSDFMNTVGGNRMSIGVGGVAGRHGYCIGIDDPIDPKEALYQTKIELANFWLENSLPYRVVDKDVVPIILIMQRICVGDPTDKLLEMYKGGVKHIILPGELNELSKGIINPPELAKHYKNGLLDPVRITQKFLDRERPKEFAFKAQILQMPIPLGTALFHVERITIDTPDGKWKQRVRFWDKAGTKDGGAFSVGVLMGEDRKGRVWIIDVVRGQWDAAVRESHIKQTAELDKKKVIIGLEQEPGSGGKESADNTVKNLKGFIVKVMRPTGDKSQRADPFATQVNGHNVYMVKADWNKEYIDELRTFSLLNSKFKDQVDASSGAFNQMFKKKKRAGVLGG